MLRERHVRVVEAVARRTELGVPDELAGGVARGPVVRDARDQGERPNHDCAELGDERDVAPGEGQRCGV